MQSWRAAVDPPATSSYAPPSHPQAAPRHSERGETITKTGFGEAVLPGTAPGPAPHTVQTRLEAERGRYPGRQRVASHD